jgi:hypothetical protein
MIKKTGISLLSILGISFWFFLAFPFAAHNETFAWLARLHTDSFLSFLAWGCSRPLAYAIVWLSYKLSGGSIYPQQIVNYLFVVLAWLQLYWAVKEKKAFSLTALMCGLCLFSCYIFTFHLHGPFYGPTMFFTALVINRYLTGKIQSSYPYLAAFAPVAGLCYPLAPLLFAVFSAGLLIGQRQASMKQLRWLILLSILCNCLFVFFDLRVLGGSADAHQLTRFVSYHMVEVNNILVLFAIILSLAVVLSLPLIAWRKGIAIAVVIMLSALLRSKGIPLVFGWLVICVLKSIYLRNWPVALILAAATVYPLTPPGGSPSYAAVALMLGALVTVMRWPELENKLSFVNGKTACVLAMLMLAILVCLRAGMRIPVVSRLADPIMSEREKTFQMAEIVDYLMKSTRYPNVYIDFADVAELPSASGNSINRRHRPVCQPGDINPYMNACHNDLTHSQQCIVITFGNEQLPGVHEIYRVKGRYAGDAIAYAVERKPEH